MVPSAVWDVLQTTKRRLRSEEIVGTSSSSEGGVIANTGLFLLTPKEVILQNKLMSTTTSPHSQSSYCPIGSTCCLRLCNEIQDILGVGPHLTFVLFLILRSVRVVTVVKVKSCCKQYIHINICGCKHGCSNMEVSYVSYVTKLHGKEVWHSCHIYTRTFIYTWEHSLAELLTQV